MKWTAQPANQEPAAVLWTGVGPRPDILLHPNIPKPLHTLAPRAINGSAWWKAQRDKATLFYDGKCWACGVQAAQAPYRKWLECHELYDIEYARGRSYFRGCCALCHACHNYIHDGRMLHLVEAGMMTEDFYFTVLARGEGVLRRAGYKLTKPKEPAVIAPWADWRLVIDGKEYGPAFATMEEWAAHFANLNDLAIAKKTLQAPAPRGMLEARSAEPQTKKGKKR